MDSALERVRLDPVSVVLYYITRQINGPNVYIPYSQAVNVERSTVIVTYCEISHDSIILNTQPYHEAAVLIVYGGGLYAVTQLYQSLQYKDVHC